VSSVTILTDEVKNLTSNRRDGEEALQIAIELLPTLLHELYALLLAEDALCWHPQVVGRQISAT